MNAQYFKDKLVQPNSGSEVYNKGIRIANSRVEYKFVNGKRIKDEIFNIN